MARPISSSHDRPDFDQHKGRHAVVVTDYNAYCVHCEMKMIRQSWDRPLDGKHTIYWAVCPNARCGMTFGAITNVRYPHHLEQMATPTGREYRGVDFKLALTMAYRMACSKVSTTFGAVR